MCPCGLHSITVVFGNLNDNLKLESRGATLPLLAHINLLLFLRGELIISLP